MQPTLPIWDSVPWPGLPALDSHVETDVCVIGLGGSGLSCVRELRALGRRVAGIDAKRVAAGAAGRNGGILHPGTGAAYHVAVRTLGCTRAVRLYELSLAQLHLMALEAPGTVRLTGLLRLATDEEEFADCVREYEAMRADGLRAELRTGDGGRGLFLPDGAAMQPLDRCRALARRAAHEGALLFEQTRAVTLSANEVVTPGGRIRCSSVVVAVDGGLETLVPELAARVRTARLQMLGTAPAPEVAIPCPVLSNHGFDYWQQLPDGSIALGGGRNRDMDSEWSCSNEPSSAIQRYLEELLRGTLGVRAPITHRWAANVSFTKSGLPVLAEVRPGVWAIGGYSGTGNLLGALAGVAVARAACGHPSEFASLLIPESGRP